MGTQPKLLVYILACLTLSACSGPYKAETLPEPNSMREGHGLFSGKDGAFTLYKSDEM